jgi:hypothetical protein
MALGVRNIHHFAVGQYGSHADDLCREQGRLIANSGPHAGCRDCTPKRTFGLIEITYKLKSLFGESGDEFTNPYSGFGGDRLIVRIDTNNTIEPRHFDDGSRGRDIAVSRRRASPLWTKRYG